MRKYNCVFSISIEFFLAIFCKNIFYNEKSSSLLVFVLALNGCDDGNLIQEDINFEDVTTESCFTNDLIYKNDKEALILDIPTSSFTTEPSTCRAPNY
jgi:hypothetical protein